MRPSCGLRRSAMSSFASTLRRVVTDGANRFGIRCTSVRTPSTRKRTTSESSCRIEVHVARPVLGRLDQDRVHEPDERRIRDAVLGVEVVCADVVLGGDLELLLDERRPPHRLARARDLLQLDLDVLGRRDDEVDRESRCEPQLVDRLDVRRVGDRDGQPVVLDPVRKRARALEHGRGNDLDRARVDRLVSELDERQVEPLREAESKEGRRDEPLVDERLRQRPLACATQGLAEPVAGHEPRRVEQVGDELRDGVGGDPRARRRRPGLEPGVALCRRRLAGLLARLPQPPGKIVDLHLLGLSAGAHNPWIEGFGACPDP